MEKITPKPLPPANDAKPEADPKTLALSIGKQIVPLVLLIVAVKVFIADIFVIPSGSMEPTLHGREYSGDRIFATKFDFKFRQPRRWEVFVFKFPYAEAVQHYTARRLLTGSLAPFKGENFIKRCVGLPGEELAIIRGDIYTRRNAGETAIRQVKPDAIQRNLWLPVYRENFANLTPEEFALSWDFPIQDKTAASVTVQSGILQTDSPQPLRFVFQPRDRRSAVHNGVRDRYTRRQSVTYTCPQCRKQTRQTVFRPHFTARCQRCRAYMLEKDVTYYDFRAGYPIPENPPAKMTGDPTPRQCVWHNVPDLRWTGRTAFAAPGSRLTVELMNEHANAQAEFTAGENGRGIARLYLQQTGKETSAAAEKEFSLPLNTPRMLEFYFCDGEYRAFADGEMLFTAAPWGHELSANPQENCEKSGAAFSVAGKIAITEIVLDRDIYYFRRPDNPLFFRLPAGEYMAMGDNCPASNDSRDWGMVPEKNLVGPAWAVWWPLDAIRIIH